MKNTLSAGTVIAVEVAQEFSLGQGPEPLDFHLTADVGDLQSALNDLTEVIQKYPQVFKGVSVHELETVLSGRVACSVENRIIVGAVPDRE